MTLQELRSIALSATQGPWRNDQGIVQFKTSYRVDLPSGEYWEDMHLRVNVPRSTYQFYDRDAKHIATFNPQTILALLDVILAADSMRASLTLGRDDVTVQPYDAVRERLEEILR